jgi:hypothetical protein
MGLTAVGVLGAAYGLSVHRDGWQSGAMVLVGRVACERRDPAAERGVELVGVETTRAAVC